METSLVLVMRWGEPSGCRWAGGGADLRHRVATGLAGDDVQVIAGSATPATFAFAWRDGTIAVAGGPWLVGALRRRQPRPSWWRAAAARSSYGAYVIHPLVLVGLMVAIGAWEVSSETKLLVVAPLGVLLTTAAGFGLTRLPGARRVL